MIQRTLYLDQIRPFIDKPLVKVLTGVRRCGKSSILAMLRDEFITKNAAAKIIDMHFESMEYADLSDGRKLYAYVKPLIAQGQKTYIMFDEIQEVAGWEKAVNSFLVDFDCDIYITGSNSRLLSSDLSTYLAGRYVEISILPLSFSETLLFRTQYNTDTADTTRKQFYEFLRKGGFPVLWTASYTSESADKIVQDIYSSIVLRDIISRNGIRNVDLLDRIVKYIFDNTGNLISGKKISDFFKSERRSVNLETVYNYLSYLEKAFIVYRVPRYDLKGKEILQMNEKFYLSDQALKYAMLGYKDSQIAGVLEGIVFLELKRRGYQVFVGKYEDREIDFVAINKEERVYVQVAFRLSGEETIDREFGNLKKIPDHYPKYVVTTEENWSDNIDGIRHVNIADFLLMEKF